MKLGILVAGFSVALAGCVSSYSLEDLYANMYNVESSGVSEFDGTKHVRVSKISCRGDLMFELYQDTPKARNGKVLLRAGVNSANSIQDGESLEFNLDGKKYAFTSFQETTNFDTVSFGHYNRSHFSNKGYLVPESFVRHVARAERVVARVHFRNDMYADGTCSEIAPEEAEKMTHHYGLGMVDVEVANTVSGTKGFEKFLNAIDDTAW